MISPIKKKLSTIPEIINKSEKKKFKRKSRISISVSKEESLPEFQRINPKYFQQGSFSPRFLNLFNNYLSSKKKKDVTNMRTMLDNFQLEKIKGMSEKELFRDEIAEEIKKYKELDQKKIKTDKRIKLKAIKDNRANLLESLSKYTKDNDKIKIFKPLSISKMFQPKKDDGIHVKSYTERKYDFTKNKIRNLESHENEEKNKIYKTFYDKFINTWKYSRVKIGLSCDFLMKESKKRINNERNTIKRFNSNWEKYKNLQEFKHPETKLDLFNFNFF